MEPIVIFKRGIAIVLLLIILIAFMLVPAVSPQGGDGGISPFRDPDNKAADWKKSSDFYKALKAHSDPEFELYSLVGSPSLLRDIENVENTLYIAMGVEKEYRPAEQNILKEFYKAGGKIIIADDYGYANSFSQEFEVNFFGQTMWDTDFEFNNSFPRIKATLNYEEYVLVMNKPTGLWTRPNVTEIQIIANGSKDSFVDRNGNGVIDIRDQQGPISVIMMYQEPLHTGAIVFIGDPGIFMNDMFDRGGGANGTDAEGKNNKKFLMDMVTNILLPNGGKIIFDESRHEQNKWSKPVYSSLETVTILTSNYAEMALLVIGLCLILSIVVYKAKDKEDWIHKYDIGTIKRRADLPDSRREVRERMKRTVYRKIRMINSLTHEELQQLTPTQLASMIKDHEINELVLNEQRDFTSEELKMLAEKIRRWEK
jgi:hypothetical protein